MLARQHDRPDLRLIVPHFHRAACSPRESRRLTFSNGLDIGTLVTVRAQLIALALLGLASTATAQSPEAGGVAEADAAYGAGELDRALSFYDRLLSTGGLPASTTAHVHLRIGILRASLEGAQAARSHFALALALDPSLTPPPELGPDAQAVFAALAGAQAGRPLRLRLEHDDAARDAPFRLRIIVEGAPPGAIGSLRVEASPLGSTASTGSTPWVQRFDGVPDEVEVAAAAWRGAGTLALSVHALWMIFPLVWIPALKRIRKDRDVMFLTAWIALFFAGALDAHGNELAAAAQDVRAAAAPGGVDLATPAPAGEDFLASPWFWLIASVVVLGGAAAVTAGVLLATAQDTYVFVPSVVSLRP